MNDSNYLRSCLYDKNTDPLCPIFRLGTITEYLAKDDFESLAYEVRYLSKSVCIQFRG